MSEIKQKPKFKWPIESLSRFPKDLQNEILSEIPEADDDYLDFINSWILESNTPIFVSNIDMIKQNAKRLEMVPQHILDIVNSKWNTCIKTKSILDIDYSRYLKYANLDKTTAKPSTVVNGEISFGISRWVASLIRGDKGIYVWKIKTD
ncbi:MAG: hypothetical protein WCJ74_02970 [bacterium]